METIKGKYTTATVYADTVDEGVRSQIYEMVSNPAINGPVAIMPDVHVGKGSVVGFTMPINDKVIPNVVGVDIGCGMYSFCVGRDLPHSVQELDAIIRAIIPMGFNIRETKLASLPDAELAKKVGTNMRVVENALGTLGGGNHFIELGIDDEHNHWFTIHSGSRRFGLDVCNYHQKKADNANPIDIKVGIALLKAKYKGQELGERIREFQMQAQPLGYLSNTDLDEYLEDMRDAQEYAMENRHRMGEQIIANTKFRILEEIDSVHNYIDPYDNIIRKGATRAYEGDVIILPFNRLEGIWIMEGKGNADWNYSAPHGAGRRMSRGEAKRTLDPEVVKIGMDLYGVYSSVDPIDEAPPAYKNPEEIQRLVEPTAKFLFSITPILNIKA